MAKIVIFSNKKHFFRKKLRKNHHFHEKLSIILPFSAHKMLARGNIIRLPRAYDFISPEKKSLVLGRRTVLVLSPVAVHNREDEGNDEYDGRQ